MINERLKEVRLKCGVSQNSFAKYFMLKQQTYQKYESGLVSIPQELMTQLAEKYGINLHWLITGQGSMHIDKDDYHGTHIYKEEDKDNINVPMTNLKVSAGSGRRWEDGELTGEILKIPKRIVKRYPRNSDLAGALVVGDSMEPTLHDGEPVVFVRNFIQGDGIYVLAVDDTLLVKRLEFDRITGVLHIISDNPHYRPKTIPISGQDNVRILGKVIIWVHGEV